MEKQLETAEAAKEDDEQGREGPAALRRRGSPRGTRGLHAPHCSRRARAGEERFSSGNEGASRPTLQQEGQGRGGEVLLGERGGFTPHTAAGGPGPGRRGSPRGTRGLHAPHCSRRARAGEERFSSGNEGASRPTLQQEGQGRGGEVLLGERGGFTPHTAAGGPGPGRRGSPRGTRGLHAPHCSRRARAGEERFSSGNEGASRPTLQQEGQGRGGEVLLGERGGFTPHTAQKETKLAHVSLQPPGRSAALGAFAPPKGPTWQISRNNRQRRHHRSPEDVKGANDTGTQDFKKQPTEATSQKPRRRERSQRHRHTRRNRVGACVPTSSRPECRSWSICSSPGANVAEPCEANRARRNEVGACVPATSRPECSSWSICSSQGANVADFKKQPTEATSQKPRRRERSQRHRHTRFQETIDRSNITEAKKTWKEPKTQTHRISKTDQWRRQETSHAKQNCITLLGLVFRRLVSKPVAGCCK
ncbi:collagen alpha-2(I) chain-like [Hemicordylus capensis]|uniref:collagen alpha-2(I) chain-like n=1 Tax=Hemicordylus capensis TaxID=884348 RepID=UPI0023041997|nr:collagen alpha-2(I) chain-like [Hemicordylus capensis]